MENAGSPTLDPGAIELAMRHSGADLASGLSGDELDELEEEWGLDLPPDHRLMLSIAMPLDSAGRWPNWRDGDREVLRKRVRWPVEGVLFDVEHNAFWHPAWPDRPSGLGDALALADSLLVEVPKLSPLYGHRYLPTQPPEAGNPVLSCQQTDIIYYGRDLLDWFEREFHSASHNGAPQPIGLVEHPPPFWSWFV